MKIKHLWLSRNGKLMKSAMCDEVNYTGDKVEPQDHPCCVCIQKALNLALARAATSTDPMDIRFTV
jgi:hypothetical protein